MTVEILEIEDKDLRLLLRSYKSTSDIKIKNKIVKLNLNLVEKIAKNFSKSYKNQYDDLVQVGCIGLINAIDKFDLNHKVSFKTYSSHFITGEIKHYLRDYYSIIKQPRELQELIPKINKARQTLKNTLKCEPNYEQIANFLSVDSDKIIQALEMEKKSFAISLDSKQSNKNDDDFNLINLIEDKKYHSFQLAQEDKIILNEAINQIKEQSQQVVEYAFFQDLTQTEIAKKLGISQMQVSRRLKSAVAELWEILQTRVTPW